MSKWKIFYTDETSIKEDNPSILGDPANIPRPKRVGVHSIIQEMDDGNTREVIEQYHYIYLASQGQWLGIGLDGLLDRLISSLDNIVCVLHGRTMTTDGFFRLKKTIREDTDVIGGISAAHNDENSAMWHHLYPFQRPVINPATGLDVYDWHIHHAGGIDRRTGLPYTDWSPQTRHRQYDPQFSEPGPYGEHREH